LNGHPDKVVVHKFSNLLQKDHIQVVSERQWGLKSKIRVFSMEGVEMLD